MFSAKLDKNKIMNTAINEFIKSGAESFPDATYGAGFRCSAYLNDGTFLPCVMLRSALPIADLALRRFEEEKRGKGIFRSADAGAYQKIVSHFVVTGNRVNHYDVSRIESSRFAIPRSLLAKIEGETTMSWTGFALEMSDGKQFSFGTTFLAEFFNLPEDYSFADVVAVHNHAYVSPSGELCSLEQGLTSWPSDYDTLKVYRERPYFTCHYDA